MGVSSIVVQFVIFANIKLDASIESTLIPHSTNIVGEPVLLLANWMFELFSAKKKEEKNHKAL